VNEAIFANDGQICISFLLMYHWKVLIVKKLKTMLSVFSTFGNQGLVDLILSKRDYRRLLEAPQKSDFERLGFAPFVLDLDDITNILDSPEVLLMSDEYHVLHKTWLDTISAPRSQFFNQIFDLGNSMGLLIYCYVRLTKPQRVIETGVAAGVSTSILLEALRRNGDDGELISIDITEKVGEVIPTNLRLNWKLEILGKRNYENSFLSILSANSDCEVFLHDSNHSDEWQLFEFENARTELMNCSVLFFDDVSPSLVRYVKQNYPEFQIYIFDEGRKFSGAFFR
jgi:predicted O-methyltransferase YrrM